MKRRGPVLAAMAAVIVGLTTAAVTPPDKVQAASSGCATFEFIGVAGSGDLPDGYTQRKTLWMGNTVHGLYDKVNRLYSGSKTTITPYGVRYAAIPVDFNLQHFDVYLNSYIESVWQGVNNLNDHIKRQADACPSQQFIISGYSQGAQVVRTAFNELADNELKGRIRTMLLFGDPTFNPANTTENVGNPNIGSRPGIFSAFTGLPGTVDPEDVQARSRSYCDAIDPVCQAPISGWQNIDAHKHYGDWATTLAAGFLSKTEPPAKCKVSTATWSSRTGVITETPGVKITNGWNQAQASPGYRFVGFVGVADEYVYDVATDTYSIRTVRVDQPSYQLTSLSLDHPYQYLISAIQGNVYYIMARAVPEKCGERTSLSFSVPVAETRHVRLDGTLTGKRSPIQGKALVWYRTAAPLPDNTLISDGFDSERVTNAQGLWQAEYFGQVKSIISPPGDYLMALAFPGDVNYLPTISPTLTVTVTPSP